MRKDFVIGDLHFGRKNNSRERHSDTMLFFEKYLIKLIRQFAASVSDGRVVFTGDLVDSKQVIETLISNDLQSNIERIAEICPVDIYIGNHELHSREDEKTYSSLKILKWIPNVRLFETYHEDSERNVAYLPFYKSKIDELQFIQKCECDTIYTHTEYSGFWYEGKMIEDDDIRSINPDHVSKFKKVINGHIHGRQHRGNILIVGTPYQLKYGEHKNTPYLHVYDHESGKVQSIENKFSPRFKIFHFFNFLDKTLEEANNDIKGNYNTIITPGEYFDKLDVNKIVECVEQDYRELFFDPIRTVKRDDIPACDDENIEISSTVDVKDKYSQYIDNSIQINGVVLDDEMRTRLKDSFKELYSEVELKVSVNDLDFS